MVDKLTTSQRNVIDFLSYQLARRVGANALVAAALAVSARSCRHCGAALAEGESDDDCSSLGVGVAQPGVRKFYAE